ncbi:hypothetical protein [Segetibacter koreensis]|uniref:hypothetical protein n=1 Tax=Segetibacter koreensis TaxID=398037 RepID=UPI0003A87DE6|nr:hypothetical protein [Segetibacter koreensis]
MFSTISWKMYIQTVFIILIIYYVALFLFYYRQEIYLFLKRDQKFVDDGDFDATNEHEINSDDNKASRVGEAEVDETSTDEDYTFDTSTQSENIFLENTNPEDAIGGGIITESETEDNIIQENTKKESIDQKGKNQDEMVGKSSPAAYSVSDPFTIVHDLITDITGVFETAPRRFYKKERLVSILHATLSLYPVIGIASFQVFVNDFILVQCKEKCPFILSEKDMKKICSK